MKLVYWDLCGRAHFIRAILKHADIEFEDSLVGNPFKDQFEGWTSDFLEKIIKHKFMPEEEGKEPRKKFRETICDYLKKIDDFLAGKKWVTGDSLSWVDFY